MTTAERMLNAKTATDRAIAQLSPHNTALDAAMLMNERRIGSVLVVDDEHRLLGIFTERDVLQRIVAEQRDPSATPLEDVMTAPVACAQPNTTSDEMRLVMRQKRVRHIPVLDGEQIVGMISLGDLNQAEISTQIQTIRYLQQYIAVG